MVLAVRVGVVEVGMWGRRRMWWWRRRRRRWLWWWRHLELSLELGLESSELRRAAAGERLRTRRGDGAELGLEFAGARAPALARRAGPARVAVGDAIGAADGVVESDTHHVRVGRTGAGAVEHADGDEPLAQRVAVHLG